MVALRTTPPRSSQYGGTSVPPPQKLRRSGARARINIPPLPLCRMRVRHLDRLCVGSQPRRRLKPLVDPRNRLADRIPRVPLQCDLPDPRPGLARPPIQLTLEILL